MSSFIQASKLEWIKRICEIEFRKNVVRLLNSFWFHIDAQTPSWMGSKLLIRLFTRKVLSAFDSVAFEGISNSSKIPRNTFGLFIILGRSLNTSTILGIISSGKFTKKFSVVLKIFPSLRNYFVEYHLWVIEKHFHSCWHMKILFVCMEESILLKNTREHPLRIGIEILRGWDGGTYRR